MEERSWKPIKDFLENIEKLSPKKTDVQDKLPDHLKIKAFIFDIYGTLLISDSGDIEQARFSKEILQTAMKKAGISIHLENQNTFLEEVLETFQNTIGLIHYEKKENNIPFPEINIIDVWEQTLEKYSKDGKISLPNDNDIRVFSMLFELMSNRVYPMPHMKKLLTALESADYPLGIISNAQFYTPIIMNYFLKRKIMDKDSVELFEPELSFFSYKMGISKPDTSPFIKLRQTLLNNYGIKAEETLYIGNDMYKDIYPAFKKGFKSALFAGDKRSLRLREDHTILEKIKPDVVFTDLKSILKIL